MRTSPVPRRLISILGAAALVASITWTLAPVAVAGGPPPACWVRNLDTGVTTGDLQVQIDTARNGHTLKIKRTCVGNFIVDKDLALKGAQPEGYPTPTLRGAGGTVLTVGGDVEVSVKNLLITGGNGGPLNPLACCGLMSGSYGGGIVNHGALTLKGSTVVQGNWANQGGGIYNNGGALTLNNQADVSNNSAGSYGGGIFNTSATLTLNDSAQVNGNSAANGGGIYTEYSTLTLNDSAQVNGNSASNKSGGIFNYYATTTLNDSAQVNGNSASNESGGIFNYYSTLTLNDSAQVNGNTAGGGIVRCVDTLNGATAGVNVKDNVPFDIGFCP